MSFLINLVAVCVCVCVRTVWFDGRWRRRWWRRRGWGCGAGVGHLQVPGLLLTGIFTKHPLSDGDLTGPPVSTAGDRQGAVSTAGCPEGLLSFETPR